MAQYPASGALFSNDRKQSPNQPDYTGNLSLDHDVVMDLYQQIQEGVEHPKADLAGWKKTAKSGRSFLSLRGKESWERSKDNMNRSAAMSTGQAVRNDVSDDEIPF